MATTLSRHWCHLTITLRIIFENRTEVSLRDPEQTCSRLSDANFLLKIAKWKTQIETFWNGSAGYRVWRGCPVTFTVVTAVMQRTLGPLELPPKGFHRIDVVGDQKASSAGIGPTSQTGTWDVNDNKYVVAHEAGHLLGLRDEYATDDATETTAPSSEWCGVDWCIMKRKHAPVDVPGVHLDEILTKLDASCCWLCRIFGRFWRRPPSSST